MGNGVDEFLIRHIGMTHPPIWLMWVSILISWFVPWHILVTYLKGEKMNTVHVQLDRKNLIPMGNLKVGQFAFIVEDEDTPYNDEIVVRGFSSVVSLTNPAHSWSNLVADGGLKVWPIQEGSIVTIIIGE